MLAKGAFTMLKTLKPAVAAGMAGLLLASSSLAAAPSQAPAGLAEKLNEVIKKDGAAGVTAIVMKDGKLLYRLDLGAIEPDAALRIESASKWIPAALVMTVVDEGKLSLDEPIGRRLP